MSNEAVDKSHTGAWITGVVAALVFYVLSIGPVEGMFRNGMISNSAKPVLEIIYVPLQLVDKTLPGRPLGAYLEWWKEFLKKP